LLFYILYEGAGMHESSSLPHIFFKWWAWQASLLAKTHNWMWQLLPTALNYYNI